MRIWIGVENFAKIESAKICVNNYTVLVGPNNSGKTFLMQLVQGLSRKCASLVDENIMRTVLIEDDETHKKYVFSHDTISKLLYQINIKLEKLTEGKCYLHSR